MRRSASLTFAAALALLLSACVPSSEVPPVGNGPFPSPTPTPNAAAPAMQANPNALTISKSAWPSGGTSYPSLTVSQPGAGSAPSVITMQSTCIRRGEINIYSTTSSGDTMTIQVQPLLNGQCVIQFGGIDGVTLLVPVTITN
ncbi:MAG: hypothetical protein ACREML_03790 [Vulcanimicrobiaceae bacterium]